MKLTKAIEIVTFEDKATLPPRNDDLWNAIRLLIEAGKTIESSRRYETSVPLSLLPGEAEKLKRG